ncbi:MAG: hypothetical protein ACEQSF_05040 [Solirubrobacteraceae bacterium]
MLNKIAITLSIFCSLLVLGQNTFTLSSKELGRQVTKDKEFNEFGFTGESKSTHI